MKLTRFLWGNYKIGLFFILIFSLIVYLLLGVHKTIVVPAAALVGDPFLCFFLLISAPCAVGIMLTNRYTKLILMKFSKFRHLSFLKYLLVEDIKHRGFPMVRWWEGGDSYGVGALMSEEVDETGEIWCWVAYPTYFWIFTGFLKNIKKDKLIFTGRSIKDLTLKNLSMGTK